MIIKELNIKNFRSYCGDNNRFIFASKGLTLILGDNGDGKTTFFESLQWLFDTTNMRGNMDNTSEKRKSEMEVGDTDKVSVSITFDHDGEKFVEKSFSFTKLDGNKFRCSESSYVGYETNGVERIQTDGKLLINRCYDAFIQRFSMFKGETELNVFDNAAALKDLVNKFSDIHKFDNLVEATSFFVANAEKAYLKEMKSDKKVSDEAKQLTSSLNKVEMDIDQKKVDIKDKKQSLELYAKKLSQLESSKETSEQYHSIKEKLEKKQKQAIRLKASITTDQYSHYLLDKYWILCAFPTILGSFQKKSSDYSKEKRKQERDFDKKQAAAKAKLDTIEEIQNELSNGAERLPWYLPDQETMEEMLHDHICKICGREAPEGSDAYNFMLDKLNQYKAHVKADLERKKQIDEISDQVLFTSSYIEEIHNLSIQLSGQEQEWVSSISREIQDMLSLNETRKEDYDKLQDEIADITDEKQRLLIQNNNISEAALDAAFKDVKGLFEQEKNASVRLQKLQDELEDLIRQRDNVKNQLEGLNPAGFQVKQLKNIYNTLEAINKAVVKAQKENLHNFLEDLENKANEYLVILSAHDFHGDIKLIQTAEQSTEIHLYSSNGTEIKKPSGSQKTVMYISVLFAISDFTQEKRDEDYPLIFDAATSSFGDSKETSFYDVINGIDKQCIIVTKDFITDGKVRIDDIKGLSCPIYRITKSSGYDERNMASISTTVKQIK